MLSEANRQAAAFTRYTSESISHPICQKTHPVMKREETYEVPAHVDHGMINRPIMPIDRQIYIGLWAIAGWSRLGVGGGTVVN